jgi:peptidoglycan/LPS O-acetylase OafA/YrhL
VLLPSLLFSFLFFDPYLEYPEIALAAMSGLLFSANLYFATINSYDDLVENPLRHLWSLGVEEHLYVLFPLLFYFVYSRGKGDCERKLLRVKQVRIFISLASLALSLIAHYLAPSIIELLGYPNLRQYAFERGRQLSFFFSPFRAWEILLGCLVAVNRFNAGTKGHQASFLLPAIGALALFSSAIAFTDADQFPGLRAAIPVLATAILITFSPDTKLQRLLSIPPLCIQGTSATPSIYGTGRSWCFFIA